MRRTAVSATGTRCTVQSAAVITAFPKTQDFSKFCLCFKYPDIIFLMIYTLHTAAGLPTKAVNHSELVSASVLVPSAPLHSICFLISPPSCVTHSITYRICNGAERSERESVLYSLYNAELVCVCVCTYICTAAFSYDGVHSYTCSLDR